MSNTEFSIPSEIGPYTIHEELGHGGMGCVYRATHTGWERDVAIKVIHPPNPWSATERATYRRAFQREAKAGKALESHPNIVRTIDYFPAIPCIVMEFVEGITLEQRLTSTWQPTAIEISATLAPVASALDYAHSKSIIHRDVNARNIIITVDGTIKVCDFGIAKFLNPATDIPTVTSTMGDVKGTLRSMSPEQLQGLPLGPPTDQYALAVLAHRLLTGAWVFEADNDGTLVYRILNEPPQLATTLASDTSTVIARALDKNPTERFPSCAAFVTALMRTLKPARSGSTTIKLARAQPRAPAIIARPRSAPKHLAELLLKNRLHAPTDAFRSRRGFSPDMESVHAVLFNRKFDRQAKIRAYRTWLADNQPCVFGKIAATNKNVFVCLLEEDEVLRMRQGDQDVQETLQDHRQAWKRLALEGMASSFVILLTSQTLITKEPNEYLKSISRRLLELYMQVVIPDDTFHTQREYVFYRRPDNTLVKFSTLPNIFCAHGDGRWWHDHRTPGGIMITSNALGHFMYARTKKVILDDTACTWALENAMRTINNAQADPSGGKTRFTHCPATFLVPRQTSDPTPLKPTSQFADRSPDHYAGYFHTDHLIPSVFFQKDRDPKSLPQYDDLGLRYIYDPLADPVGHAELMAGTPAVWYDVRSNMDRLPSFVDPERTTALDRQTRGRLAKWLEERLKARL